MTGKTLAGRLRGQGVWLMATIMLLVFGGVGLLAFRLPPSMLVAILAGGILVLLWLAVPELVILTLLLLRSSIDGFMEMFTLFAGSPLSMNLSGATNSLAVGLGILTVLRRLLRRQSMLGAAPGWAYSLFLLIGLIAIPGSVDPAVSIKDWARIASGLAIYLMVTDVVHDERGARRFVVAIMVSSLVPLLVGWYQKLTGGGYFFLGFTGTEFAYRPQGTFGHPGGLGAYLVILLTLAAGLFFSMPSPKMRVTLLVWAAAAVGCLLLTLARSEWVGLLAAFLCLGLFRRRRLALLTVAVAAASMIGVPFLRERLTSAESVFWRLDLWQAALHLAWPPTLFGKGLNTSPWHINQLLPNVESPPHNDYLKVLIETGLVGFLTYGLWLLALLRHSYRAFRRSTDRAISWRALSLFSITIAGMAMSVTDNYLGHTAVQWYLWAFVALVPESGRWPEPSSNELVSSHALARDSAHSASVLP